MLSHCWVVVAHELLLDWNQIMSIITYQAFYTLPCHRSCMLYCMLHWLLDNSAANCLKSGHQLMQNSAFCSGAALLQQVRSKRLLTVKSTHLTAALHPRNLAACCLFDHWFKVLLLLRKAQATSLLWTTTGYNRSTGCARGCLCYLPGELLLL